MVALAASLAEAVFVDAPYSKRHIQPEVYRNAGVIFGQFSRLLTLWGVSLIVAQVCTALRISSRRSR